jgi:hypothetical protein
MIARSRRGEPTVHRIAIKERFPARKGWCAETRNPANSTETVVITR